MGKSDSHEIDEHERDSYASMIMAMAVDYRFNRITWETFVANLKIAIGMVANETIQSPSHK